MLIIQSVQNVELASRILIYGERERRTDGVGDTRHGSPLPDEAVDVPHNVEHRVRLRESQSVAREFLEERLLGAEPPCDEAGRLLRVLREHAGPVVHDIRDVAHLLRKIEQVYAIKRMLFLRDT